MSESLTESDLGRLMSSDFLMKQAYPDRIILRKLVDEVRRSRIDAGQAELRRSFRKAVGR